jgi:Domain of unknown function (DUF222)
LSVAADKVVADQASAGALVEEVNSMPAAIPEPGPDEQQPPGSAPGPDRRRGSDPNPEGSADTGPAPPCYPQGPQPEPPTADGLPAGLDYAALVAGLAASGALSADPDDQDAEFAEWQAAEEEGRLGRADPAVVAAVAVEHMVPGAAQAGWLEVAAAAAGRLDENALAGVAIAARRAASRAAAAELAAVAQITARAAAADRRIGLQADGRPGRVCADAVGQIELALRLTAYGAQEWADLAVTLTWRLPATGQALARGDIDLDRAQLIAQATSVLTQQQAREVEEQILPVAGGLARTYLRERLARAVIAADPEGADRRREQAERHADVRLHADHDQTATITGSKLPQIHAAAALAKLTALARACKAAGMPGSLGFHRAQAMIGLILGTMPPTPPAEDAPPDQPPPDPGSGPGGAGDGGPGPGRAGGRGLAGDGVGDEGGWDDVPAPRDEDAPPDDGLDDADPAPDQGRGWDPAEDDDDPFGTRPVPAWPALGAIPPALARRPAAPAAGRPAPGLLDATIPWATLTGLADRPATLGRIGPITAAQARLLAHAAEHDPAA